MQYGSDGTDAARSYSCRMGSLQLTHYYSPVSTGVSSTYIFFSPGVNGGLSSFHRISRWQLRCPEVPHDSPVPTKVSPFLPHYSPVPTEVSPLVFHTIHRCQLRSLQLSHYSLVSTWVSATSTLFPCELRSLQFPHGLSNFHTIPQSQLEYLQLGVLLPQCQLGSL